MAGPVVVPDVVSVTASEVLVAAVLRSRDLLAFFGRDRDREAPAVAAAVVVPINIH